MSYDSLRQRIVLFGGYGGAAYLRDTREWDGTEWLLQAPATSPPAFNPVIAMTFDAGRGDLTSIQMSGCALFTSVELPQALSNSNGTASLTLTLGNMKSLVGQTFYAQGFVLDASANTLGVASSNALEGKGGSR